MNGQAEKNKLTVFYLKKYFATFMLYTNNMNIFLAQLTKYPRAYFSAHGFRLVNVEPNLC